MKGEWCPLISDKGRGETEVTPHGHTFHSIKILLQAQGEVDGFVTNTGDQGIPPHPFLLMSLPILANHAGSEDDKGKARKREAFWVLWSFLPPQ